MTKVAGGQQAEAQPVDYTVVNGRERPVNPRRPEVGNASEIEFGTEMAGDFAIGAVSPYSTQFPYKVYAFAGRAGQSVTAAVASEHVHTMVTIARNPDGTGRVASSKLGGVDSPKDSSVSGILKKDGIHYIIITGLPLNEKGKFAGRYASAGRFTLALTDMEHPTAVAFSGNPAVPAVASRTAAATTQAPAKLDNLADTYAQLCSEAKAAATETCVTLRKAMAAKIKDGAAAPASASKRAAGSEAAAASPTGLAVTKLAGKLPRLSVVAVEPDSPAAQAGLRAGDVIAFATDSTGAKRYLATQVALDDWAREQEPGATLTFTYVRARKSATADLVLLDAPEPEPVALALSGGTGGPFDIAPGPFTQKLSALYGASTKFEMKLPAGKVIEVMIDAPDGSAELQVCGPSCPKPARVENGNVLYRFTSARNTEIKVKVQKTQGPKGQSYRVSTREVPRGYGAEMLARLESLPRRPYLISTNEDGIPSTAAVEYVTLVKGQKGKFRYRYESGKTDELELALDGGELAWSNDGEKGLAEPGDDGAVYFGGKESLYGWLVGADGSLTRSYYLLREYADSSRTPTMGGFERVPLSSAKPSTEKQVAALLRTGPARIETAKAKRMLRWGSYAQLAGRSWIYATPTGPAIGQFDWEVPGRSLIARFWKADWYKIGNPFTVLRLGHNGKTDVISGSYTASAGTVTPVTIGYDGLGHAIETLPAWKGMFETVSPNEISLAVNYSTPKQETQLWKAIEAPQMAQLADRARQLEQQRQAQAAAAKQNSGGGILGVLGQVAQAWNIANDPNAYLAATTQAFNNLAPGLGDAMGIVAGTNSGVGAPGVSALANGGGAVRASYPTKPNLAVGACSGFTEANYRQYALSGGPDTQLKTMCGQAFEYYTMYKRAIAQGYSEADANRTYAAHEQSARVAQDFVTNYK